VKKVVRAGEYEEMARISMTSCSTWERKERVMVVVVVNVTAIRQGPAP
jgi:hypothetical protein